MRRRCLSRTSARRARRMTARRAARSSARSASRRPFPAPRSVVAAAHVTRRRDGLTLCVQGRG